MSRETDVRLLRYGVINFWSIWNNFQTNNKLAYDYIKDKINIFYIKKIYIYICINSKESFWIIL
jgi:hypothetical protein